MNAFDVDYWIGVMCKYSWTPRTLDEKSQHALMYLFHLTDQIAPVGRDNCREFWITAKRGSVEDFQPYYDEDATEEELAEAMQEQYPKEAYWYKFVSVHHTGCRKGEFFGVFLNGKPVLSMNDPNEDGNPFNAIELLDWLIQMATGVLDKLRAGTYNAEIQEKLPDDYKYGVITRKDYWDIYPEDRADYRSSFKEWQIKDFLRCKDEFSADWIPENCLQHITARDFYEACAVCYKAVRMEQRVHFPFKDSKEEHLRYNGTTPKELYYMFADGRDDGLFNVPLDDAAAFAEWRNQEGPYYEFNGCHPWEILPSGSVEYSMHLQVMKSPNGFYYGLSGSTFQRSKDTIHSYLAMRKAGLPVKIYNGLKMAARFEEADMIGIVPQGRSTSYVDRIMQYEITDAVHLSDDEKSEQVAAKTIWQPEIECKLL